MEEVKAAIILFVVYQMKSNVDYSLVLSPYGGDIWIAEILGIDKKTVAKGVVCPKNNV